MRFDWVFEVRTLCQRFYCRTISGDRAELEAGIADLARTLPAATSPQEVEALTELLRTCTANAGVRFHDEHHRRTHRPRCTGSAVERAWLVWGRRAEDPRVLLGQWANVFLSEFDAGHHVAPAEKAATMLRTRFREPLRLTDVALTVGVSRSVLARSFQTDYQMSVGEYHARVRLRWFVEQLRLTRGSATNLARDAGYGSYHNLLQALRQRTGLTPSEIRQISLDNVHDVLDSSLSLMPGGTPRGSKSYVLPRLVVSKPPQPAHLSATRIVSITKSVVCVLAQGGFVQ